MRSVAAFTLVAAETEKDRVDRIFKAYNKPDSPGCAVAVIRNGSFVYRKAMVWAAWNWVFRSPHDPCSTWVPCRNNSPPPAWCWPPSKRQMMHHTSSFRDVLRLLYFSGRNAADVHSTEEPIDLVARQKALNNNGCSPSIA
jgi:CubicO group peptidase (beta-lactamase class C family)